MFYKKDLFIFNVLSEKCKKIAKTVKKGVDIIKYLIYNIVIINKKILLFKNLIEIERTRQ